MIITTNLFNVMSAYFIICARHYLVQLDRERFVGETATVFCPPHPLFLPSQLTAYTRHSATPTCHMHTDMYEKHVRMIFALSTKKNENVGKAVLHFCRDYVLLKLAFSV